MRLFLSSLYLLGVILLVTGSPVEPLKHHHGGGGHIKPVDSTKPARNGTEETSFFHMMKKTDQMWLMKESLKVFLDEPQREPADPVPDVLRVRMLNGKVPADFQKAFTQWVLDEYKFEREDVRQLLQEKEVCGPTVCTDLPGLGQTCCPFG